MGSASRYLDDDGEQEVIAACQGGRHLLEAAALCARARVEAYRGNSEPARSLALRALDLGRAVTYPRFVIDAHHVLGFVELSLGNAGAALPHLETALAGRRAQGIVEPYLFYFLPDTVEALIVNDRKDDAEAVLAPFEASAERCDRAWAIATAAWAGPALVTS